MIKDLKKLLQDYNKDLFDYSKNSFFESIYRLLAIIIFPLIKNLSPNFISTISILLGFVALFLSLTQELVDLSILMIFFLISFVLDFSDGMVARFQKKTSFHGRFLDGLFDIIVLGLLHILLYEKTINENTNFFHSYFYLVTLLLFPIQHLILDRYSAIARWINNANSKKIRPYNRNIFFGKITKLFFDLQHVCIWFLFINRITYNYVVDTFFLLSFIASILSLGIYLYLSNKNFSNQTNQNDNKL